MIGLSWGFLKFCIKQFFSHQVKAKHYIQKISEETDFLLKIFFSEKNKTQSEIIYTNAVLTRSSFLGNWFLMRVLVRLRNHPVILLASICMAFRPVASSLFVAVCLWPCSTGSENCFLKWILLPKSPGTALHKGIKKMLGLY